MKLLKKLLPLTSIGLVALTVAPVAASCTTSASNVKTFTVKFDANGGNKVNDQVIVEGQLVAYPVCVKSGYVLEGWKHNGKLWNFDNDKVTQDMELIASWVENPLENLVDLKKYTVQHDQHEKTTEHITKEQAAEMYFGNADAVNIMVDDIYNYLKNEDVIMELYMQEEWVQQLLKILGLDWMGKPTYFGARVLNPSIKYDKNVSAKYALVSGTIILQIKSDVKTEGTEIKEGDYTLTTIHQLTDVPYSMMNGTITDVPEWSGMHWATHLDRSDLVQYDKWEITRAYEGDCEYLDGHHDIESSMLTWNKDNMPYESLTVDPLTFITWYSTYMFNVKAD